MILSFSLAFTSLLCAEFESASQLTVLSVTYSSLENESAIIMNIISKSVKFELEYRGFKVVLINEKQNNDMLAMLKNDKNNKDIILQLAHDANAQFVIISRYKSFNESLEIDFYWYNVESSTLASTTRFEKRRLDLSFDTYLALAISDVLNNNKELSLASASGAYSTKPTNHIETITPSQALEPQIEDWDKDEKEKQNVVSTTSSPKEYKPRFEFLVGAAPFLAIGRASDYFKVGLMPSFCVNYHFHIDSMYLAIGLSIGVTMFSAEGTRSILESYLIPVGFDIRFGVNDIAFMAFYIHASGGMAFLAINTNDGELKSKMLPFVVGGIGLTFPFFDNMGLAIDANYMVFFEQQSPIMGFAPAGNLYLRF